MTFSIHDKINPEIFVSLVNQFKESGGDSLSLDISSPGGDVIAGFGIANKISNIPQTSAHISGMCGSIATVISSACKKVTMDENALYMIHNSSMGIRGGADELRRGGELLEKINGSISRVYKARTSLPMEQIQSMMEKETFLTANEAQDLGFVDEVIPSKYSATAYINSDIMNIEEIKNELRSWFSQEKETPSQEEQLEKVIENLVPQIESTIEERISNLLEEKLEAFLKDIKPNERPPKGQEGIENSVPKNKIDWSPFKNKRNEQMKNFNKQRVI